MTEAARVRSALPEDVQRLMRFIDRHWRKDHVLSRDRILLEFQHARTGDEQLDIIIAEREGEEELLGMLGFIRASTYDPALPGRDTAFLALWKVRPDANEGGLGLRLHQAVRAAVGAARLAVNGINEQVIPLYRALGYHAAPLTHFVRVNPEAAPYRLLKGVVPEAGSPQQTDIVRFLPPEGPSVLQELDAALCSQISRPRSAAYFEHRYRQHPRFTYDVRVVHAAGVPRGLIAFRPSSAEGARALHAVDLWLPNDVLAKSGHAFDLILRESGAEYLDIHALGLPHAALHAAGFSVVDPEGPRIVPLHFQPFVPRNVTIFAAWRGDPEPPIIMRADGDQDRPS